MQRNGLMLLEDGPRELGGKNGGREYRFLGRASISKSGGCSVTTTGSLGV